MVKILLFSDVHSNLPALQAFERYYNQSDASTVFCLGDLIGYNVWPNEVIEWIKMRKIATIAGNHDAAIGKEATKPSPLLMNQLVNDDNKAYLKTLPDFIRLNYSLGAKDYNILLVHGGPENNTTYLTEDLSASYYWDMLEKHNADLICCAHTHKPFHKTIQRDNQIKHIVNIGSLGKPKDGNQKGCCTEISLTHSTEQETNIKVEFVRIAYDVSKACQGVLDCEGLPDDLAKALIEAR